MRNKCKPGFICVENISVVIFLIIIFSFGYLYYKSLPNQLTTNNNTTKEQIPQQININNYSDYASAYDNPYNPPFRNDGYLSVPINVSTNIGAVSTSFRQLGILTPTSQSSKDNILPLMGRPLFTSRSKFQYYTISNQNNQVKLPVSVKGRSGLDEYGVDEVFDGDTVYVEGYEDVFKVTKYDNGTMRYLPL
jgi:hypothetical protein